MRCEKNDHFQDENEIDECLGYQGEALNSFVLSYRYAYGKFSSSHEATIGGCFLTKNEDLGDYIVKYEMWDTAG